MSDTTTPAATAETVLEVDGLNVDFWVDGEFYPAAIGLKYDVRRGETLAIVGESGSGKSSSSMALLGLLPPNGRATGSARLGDRELIGMSSGRLRRIRGKEVAVIFQEPMTALNPVYTIGFQIVETLRSHFEMSPKQAKARAIELLKLVEIPEAERRFDAFPHQLSGGQRQRAMIAQALACEPKLLIADEPTTALDVTVQAQIMELLKDLQRDTGMGLLLITHDLGVVNEVADRVLVMYAGTVVETGSVDEVFSDPSHPYTEGLMASIARVDQKGQRLNPIVGAPPNLANLPTGCPFHPRCPRATERCPTELPLLREVVPGRRAACHYAEEVLGV